MLDYVCIINFRVINIIINILFFILEIGIGIGNTFTESIGLPILFKSIVNNPVSK